jgi:two-component system NtrC family response regulator
VVAATNRNLADMVSRSEFREDLLYRINLIPIHLPPLRERRDDIPVLASRFLQTVAQMYGRDPITFSDEARRWLQTQPWPGNVRQLRQWIERAVLINPSDVLGVDDIRTSVAMERADTDADVLPPVGSMTMDEIERGMIEKALKHHGRNLSRVADALGLSRAALYRRLEKYEIQV